jgi:hypothetical protein
MTLYDIQLIVMLPFRPYIKGLGCKKKYKSENWETTFTLSLQETFEIGSGGFTFSKEELRYHSIAVVETKLPYNGNKADAKNHAQIRNPIDHVTPSLIEKLNYFLNLVRYSGRSIDNIQNIRNVGLLDLPYYSIVFEGETIFSRGNLSRPGDRAKAPNIDKLEPNIPKEWSLISKSQDLVNHGFASEGFLVAFALLDHQVQQFIETKMDSISTVEREEILRGIERKRMTIYLGSLCKLLTGESILDDDSMSKKLSWVNKKRNNIMHNGESCNSTEAEKGLNIILEFLQYLQSKGANLILPDKLLIW